MKNNNIFEQFESDGAFAPTKAGLLAGNAGHYALYTIEILYLAYSSYHGISASLSFAGSGLAKIPQIMGIVIIELTLLALNLMWHNNKITGTVQTVIAVFCWLALVGLTMLSIVGDSQIHAGYNVTGWLQVYLQWVLPISAVPAMITAVLITSLAPEKMQERKRANQLTAFSDASFDAFMVKQSALAKADLQIQSLQIAAQVQTARLIAEQINNPQVVAMIQRQALHNVPALLQSAGINLPYALDNSTPTLADTLTPTMAQGEREAESVTGSPAQAESVTGAKIASDDGQHIPMTAIEDIPAFSLEREADFLAVKPMGASVNGRHSSNGKAPH